MRIIACYLAFAGIKKVSTPPESCTLPWKVNRVYWLELVHTNVEVRDQAVVLTHAFDAVQFAVAERIPFVLTCNGRAADDMTVEKLKQTPDGDRRLKHEVWRVRLLIFTFGLTA